MTRLSSADNAEAVTQSHIPFVLLADFDFVSGHVYVNSADREYSFNGHNYLAVGKLCGIGPIRESADLSPEKLEFTLTGVDTGLLATTLTEKYHGRSATVHVAYLDYGFNMVDTPHLLWEGRMDTMAIRTQEGGSAISLVCENRLVLWNKSAGWLYSNEHQAEFSSGDRFFDQVARLANKIVRWGEASVNTGTIYNRPDFQIPGYWGG